MSHERLYILHGMGPDAVGLVGNITQAIAGNQGNIIDLRQDVLHGLFIIYLVVDLSGSSLRLEEFTAMVRRLGEDTGIALQVDNYNPVPRNPDKRNMLAILLGEDQTGIIASVSRLLGKYSVNIEFARTIAREGVFLMELLTDTGACTIPPENLRSTLSEALSRKEITTLFQTEQVFNKKRRVLLFDIPMNMMDAAQRSELAGQAGLDPDDLDGLLADASGKTIAGRLEGLPVAIYDSITADVRATSDTVELLQTLKTMGYVIGLFTSASTFFVERLAARLGIDHFHGLNYLADDDTRSFSGAIQNESPSIDLASFIASIAAMEKIAPEDITVIGAEKKRELPGIHPVFNIGTMLDLFNRHSLSRTLLAAVIASFGSGRTIG